MRSPVGVPPRRLPGDVGTSPSSFRPGFLGRGRHDYSAKWALPTPTDPSPVRTARPATLTGGWCPKPPGSGLQLRPRAPPSLPNRDVPPRPVLSLSENHWTIT